LKGGGLFLPGESLSLNGGKEKAFSIFHLRGASQSGEKIQLPILGGKRGRINRGGNRTFFSPKGGGGIIFFDGRGWACFYRVEGEKTSTGNEMKKGMSNLKFVQAS